MIKKVLSIIVFLLGVVFVSSISAEEIRQESRGYQCLDFVHCSDGGPNDRNKRCEPIDEKVHTSVHWGHRAQVDLSDLEDLPPNGEILVTECINSGEDLDGDGKADSVCTTGDSTQDKILFCGSATASNPKCDHYSLLKNHPKIQYGLDKASTHGVYHLVNGVYKRAIGVPIKIGADGRSTVQAVEWEGHSPENIERKYLAWYYDTTVSTPIPTQITPTTIAGGGLGGQQQARLNFEQRTPSPTSPPPQVNDCKGKAWDPYGIVFDMKSLEPIPDVDVLLKMRNPQNVFDSEYAKSENLLIFNPFDSDSTGEYLFFVKDGDYVLEPLTQSVPHPYTHPILAQQSSLAPNTLSIYSDIYFKDSPPILQRGAIQHRDIPLMPLDGVGKEYPLEIVSENVELGVDGKMIYSGRVSHPYAEIVIETCRKVNNIESCSNPQIYGKNNGGANKFGNFTFTLDQTQLQSGEYYRRSFRKVDLNALTTAKIQPVNLILHVVSSLFQPKVVNAQEPSNSARIEPVVSYIEGYAYDAEGNLLPNAQVLIKVSLSEMPLYQTVANANGYYKITSEFLPKTEYAIEYLVGNDSARITTSQLLEQNKAFIEAEKINPYLNTTQAADPRRTVTPSYIPQQKISSVPNEFATAPSIPVQETQTQATINNNLFLIGSILLLLIAAAGILIGVYLYRKRMQETQI